MWPTWLFALFTFWTIVAAVAAPYALISGTDRSLVPWFFAVMFAWGWWTVFTSGRRAKARRQAPPVVRVE